MVVMQAKKCMEDRWQIESGSLCSNQSGGPHGTFIGIYDGRGGPHTSQFINDYLFHRLKKFTSGQRSMSEEVIRRAFQATEDRFMSLVSRQWYSTPNIATVGSCCLVGVICNGTLFIANLGNSRAVLGSAVKETGEVLAMQLSTEHNLSIESVRQELQSLHPDDPNIVVLKHNAWRVKGILHLLEMVI
ncbi:phosphatase 2C 79 [Spatholobus suberectus]|nr:phosphatase 2C 79 [Spatholobus suberectus]